MSDKELEARIAQVEQRNRRLQVALVLLAGVILVGSSTLGINGILSSPNNSNPAFATLRQDIIFNETMHAIETSAPWLDWHHRVQTATAIRESSFLASPIPTVIPQPTPTPNAE